MLTKEEVLKLAKLSRIALSEAEVEKFQKDLDTVLGYVDELKKVNTDGLEEVNQVTAGKCSAGRQSRYGRQPRRNFCSSAGN